MHSIILLLAASWLVVGVLGQLLVCVVLPTQNTMCDFHNFGLIFTGQCTYCLPQRLKSTLTPLAPSGLLHLKKFQTMLILVFEVIVQPPKTHFLTFSNETKIMKITHSGSPSIIIMIQVHTTDV